MWSNIIICAAVLFFIFSSYKADKAPPKPPEVIPLTNNPALADCIYTTAEPYKNGTKFPVIRCPNSVVIIDDRPSY